MSNDSEHIAGSPPSRNLVSKVRKSMGLTQAQLAQLLGVHHLTISKWERGLLEPTPWHVAILHAIAADGLAGKEHGRQVVEAMALRGVAYALFVALDNGNALRNVHARSKRDKGVEP